MKAIKINHLTLTSDDPKIAVSITASDQNGLNHQLSQIKAVKPDLVEWRIDALNQIPNQDSMQEALKKIHRSIQPRPLIATFRTQNEGGGLKANENQYFEILKFLSTNSFVDILDVELRHNKNQVKAIVARAHQHNVKVIMSNHDFDNVPSNSIIINRMQKMQDVGADIAKMAVMPQQKADVMRFMQTSLQVNQSLSIPIVTMAMGDLGKITRISGIWTGSVISFGSMNTHISSAPGQISVPKLRDVLRIIRGDRND